jgi:hypothetical protein
LQKKGIGGCSRCSRGRKLRVDLPIGASLPDGLFAIGASAFTRQIGLRESTARHALLDGICNASRQLSAACKTAATVATLLSLSESALSIAAGTASTIAGLRVRTLSIGAAPELPATATRCTIVARRTWRRIQLS